MTPNQVIGLGEIGSKCADTSSTVAPTPTPVTSPSTTPSPRPSAPIAAASRASAVAATREVASGTRYIVGLGVKSGSGSHPIARVQMSPNDHGMNHSPPTAKYTSPATTTAHQFMSPSNPGSTKPPCDAHLPAHPRLPRSTKQRPEPQEGRRPVTPGGGCRRTPWTRRPPLPWPTASAPVPSGSPECDSDDWDAGSRGADSRFLDGPVGLDGR
jgi:hypothetical protein